MATRATRASGTPSGAQRDGIATPSVRSSRSRQTPRAGANVERISTPEPSSTALNGAELPPYVPPEFPLSKDALNRLAVLTAHNYDKEKDLSDKRLKDAVASAISALTESAGDINECLAERDAAVTRSRKVLEAKRNGRSQPEESSPPDADDGQVLDNEDAAAATERQEKDEADLAELKQRIEGMTRRMEISLRKAIDFKAPLADFAKGVNAVDTAARSALPAAEQQTQTQLTHPETQPTQDDSTPNPTIGTNAGPSTEHSDATTTPVQQPSLPMIFDEQVKQAAANYNALSLPDRYAEDNDYANFKRMVHYASYTGDAPPVPHARTWFLPSGPAPAAGVTLPSHADEDDENGTDDEDEDINIVRERISTKCPITMAPFTDPVTSLKCPHSFERSAILAMIANARPPTRQPGMPAPVKTVECPVSGCEQELTRQDVAVDAVTVRRIRRVQEAEKRDAEAAAGRSSPASAGMVIDDEATQGDDLDDIDDVDNEPVTRVKRERYSRRRQVDEDDDEDMEDV